MYASGPQTPALTLLFHPEVDRVGERALLWKPDVEKAEAFLSRRQTIFQSPGAVGPARPLEDPYVSRRPIRFSAARFGGIRIDCTRTGTRVIANDDWISEDRVFLGVEVERGVVLVLSERISVLLHNVTVDEELNVPHFGLVGESPPMLRLRREMHDCAGATSPVLVSGEPGSGKRTVARAIHDASGRDRPWVSFVSADDSPPHTSISDLFGQARGGSLLLQAVDRMDACLQEEMARSAAGACDVRMLATFSGPRPRAKAGLLVEKLDWTRLEVPSLQERRDDVARLIFHFLRQYLEKQGVARRLTDPGPYAMPWFPVRLVAALASYEWPDNVRQLRRVARRLVRENYTRKQIDIRIDLEELLEGGSEVSTMSWGGWSIEDSRKTRPPSGRHQLSETEILSALRAHRWQAEPAAEHLGITPEALFAMMEKFFDKGEERRKSSRRNFNPF